LNEELKGRIEGKTTLQLSLASEFTFC
jgi:hypothetical protein